MVSNAAEITTAMNVGVGAPGDTLIMVGNIWTDQLILFGGANGTLANPIVLMPEMPGTIKLEGSSRIKIFGNYLVVYGLKFQNPNPSSLGTNHIVEFRNSSILANHCRFTNSHIYYYNSNNSIDNKWVSIYGTNNRVDHNRFEGKSNYGPTLVVWYASAGGFPNESPSTYHQIDHNYFLDRTLPLGGNGGETIRVGDSNTSRTNGFNIFEFNLFEHCDGEIEIISNKSEFNTYRYNTFRANNGQLTLRHGANCFVHGNFFLGENYPGSSGVRVIDGNHEIYNNYFQDLIGASSSDLRAPITIMNGDVNPAANGYWKVYNSRIWNNSFVNCDDPLIRIGVSGGTVNADSIFFSNNLLSASQGPFIKYDNVPTNIFYFRNHYYGSSLGIGSVGWLNLNPDLVFDTQEELYRLSSSSLLIDSGAVVPPIIDFDGQSRISVFDIGSDEYSTAPITITPLLPQDVDPCFLKPINDCPNLSIVLGFNKIELKSNVKHERIEFTISNFHYRGIAQFQKYNELKKIWINIASLDFEINDKFDCIDIYPISGKNYYRIVQYVRDNENPTTIADLELNYDAKSKEEISIFVTPSQIEIQCEQSNAIKSWAIYNLNGQILQSNSFERGYGNHSTIKKNHNLPDCVILEVQTYNNIRNKKLLFW